MKLTDPPLELFTAVRQPNGRLEEQPGILPMPSQFIGRGDQGAISNPQLPAYHFKLVKRSGMVCLWEKSRGGKGPPRYEVVILQVRHLTRFPNGDVTLCHEAMPSPESWGVSAWSPATLEAAEERFDQLTTTRRRKSI